MPKRLGYRLHAMLELAAWLEGDFEGSVTPGSDTKGGFRENEKENIQIDICSVCWFTTNCCL